MSETEHEPEQALEAMEDQSEQLGEEISEARDEWESKKADPAVPGAGGDPQPAGEDGEGLDAEEPLDPQDPANEDL
jgi:hypothetical protein